MCGFFQKCNVDDEYSLVQTIEQMLFCVALHLNVRMFSSERCPVRSWISFSGIPFLYKSVAAVALRL